MKVTTKFVTLLCGGVLLAGAAWWVMTPNEAPLRIEEGTINSNPVVSKSIEERFVPSTSPSLPSAPVIASVSPTASKEAITVRAPAPSNLNQIPANASRAVATNVRRRESSETAARRAYQVAARAQQEGMRLPAALLRGGIDPARLSPQQQKVLSSLEEEFLAEIDDAEAFAPYIADAEGNNAAPLPKDAWESARERADSRFRLFFGDEAYNYMSMEASLSGRMGQD